MSEWIEGLPTEPGSYYFAVWFDDDDEPWGVCPGSAVKDGGELLILFGFTGIYPGEYDQVKHQPAPPLPEAPS